MRIDLLAPPFSGHLHPLLAIARELAAEFDVRVLSTPTAQARIRTAGLRGRVVLGEDDDRVLTDIANPPHAVKGNPIRMSRQFHSAIALMGRLKAELQVLYAHERPDLVIADFTLPAVGLVAQQLGIVWWTSMPSPCVIETPDGPPAYMGGLKPAEGWASGFKHAAYRKTVRSFKQLIFKLHQRQIEELGLRQLYRKDGSEHIYSPSRLLALGLQELEFERSWPPATCFVGPKLYTPATYGGADPVFEPGKRHVLVTAGTHLRWIKDALSGATLKAAQAMPEVVFHFTDGDESQTQTLSQRNFVRLSYVDYEKHLAHYDLVVHHGGAGILYYCLLLGKPVVVYPVDYDQFDHAARLEHHGLAVWLRDLGGLQTTVADLLEGRRQLSGCQRFQALGQQVLGDLSFSSITNLVHADFNVHHLCGRPLDFP
jgi:UDP:flavonoid glycosyltransferase YjiC (YdhE family)